MATTTNFGWETPDDTDLVKDGALAIRTLGSAIDTSLVDLKGGTTGQVLSKTSNTDMDFTWVTSDDANAIQNAIVDAKGDLIAASAADTPARLAVGNNGETLVADSSATTGLRWQGNFAAGKNKVINGDFGIWQRGTSSTSNGFLADRFNLNTDVASFTQSRQAFTPGTAPVAGYEGKFFYRFALTTLGAATYWYLNHYIEDVQTLAGQTITFSFWAKADSARNVTLGLNQNFGSGGSSVVGTDLGSKTLSTSWTRYTSTVSLPSISGKTVGTSSYIQPYFAITPSAGMTIDIWGVQLEAGNTATAFQTATGTLAGELAACQRYFYRLESNSESGFNFGTGTYYNTTDAYLYITFPTQMRVAPTASYTIGSLVVYANGANKTPTGFVTSTAGRYGAMNYTTGITGATGGNAAIFQTSGTTNTIFSYSSEL